MGYLIRRQVNAAICDKSIELLMEVEFQLAPCDQTKTSTTNTPQMTILDKEVEIGSKSNQNQESAAHWKIGRLLSTSTDPRR